MLNAAIAGVILMAGLVAGDWIGSLAAAVLVLGWFLLRVPEGPPVLFFAFAFQWVQVNVGLFYTALTGRTLTPMADSDYRTMMLLGLGTLVALAFGVFAGLSFVKRRFPARPIHDEAFSTTALLSAYGALTVSTGLVQALAWEYPLFTQAIIAVSFGRLALVYLLLRRFTHPHLQFVRVGALLAAEVVLGITGFFASFREPLILAAIALSEVFDRRRASHWITGASVVVTLGLLGTFWMGVRQQYRQDFFDVEMFSESRDLRIERLQTLWSQWTRRDRQELLWDLDYLVERVWVIYYPALALQRVPALIPHTEGALTGGALLHIVTPRVLFPDKPPLLSDSEKVREYSGIWVAGAEQNTSIAFGYAAEAYVDFGVPVMFVPVVLWGLFLGGAYQTLLVAVRHREVAIPLVTVVFWLSLFLFEVSWAKWMGTTGTLLIYLGGLAYVIDRWLRQRYTVGALDTAPPPAAFGPTLPRPR